MFNLFRKNRPISDVKIPKVDIHSHLLPALDDGVQTIEESVSLLKSFEELGYKKVITTPHIMGDFYRNTPEDIKQSLGKVKSAIKGHVDVELEAAAEYYLDESFIAKLEDPDAEVLMIDGQYVLFETGFLDEPVYLKKAIFKIQSLGHKALLAHPERYQYLITDWDAVLDLRNRSVLFQINLNSLTPFYSKPVQKMCRRLIKAGFVDFVGSDCHNAHHFQIMKEALTTKDYEALEELKTLNDELL